MKRFAIFTLICLAAPPAFAQDDRVNGPWSRLEYDFAAQCVWEHQPAIAKEWTERVLSGATGKESLKGDLSACTEIDGLKDREREAKRLGAAVIEVRFDRTADCLLISGDIKPAEVQPLVKSMIEAHQHASEFRLTPALAKKTEQCDRAISDWVMRDDLSAKLFVRAIAGRTDWRKKLDTWDADPTKQNQSAKNAGCIWRKNAIGARHVLISVVHGQVGTKLDRLMQSYGPTIAPCIAAGKTDSSQPYQVLREIVNLAQYNPHGAQ